MDELLVGLIGAGGMGKGLANGLKAADGARLVAVADVADGAAQAAADELGEGIDAYTDPAEMLAREDIGAVLVAVPNWLHAETTIAAAAVGKHVFCEKPMALHVTDAQAMIDACDDAGVKLMIGQVLRYNSPFVRIIEDVRAGKFGEPCAMQVNRMGGAWSGAHAVPWRMEEEKVGGPLFEINAHEIDFIRCILGEVTSVYATMANFVSPDIDYEDYAAVNMNFEGGRKATLLGGHCAYQTAYDGKLYCAEGTLFFSAQTGALAYTLKGDEQVVTPYGELGALPETGVQRETREFVEAVIGDTDATIPGIEGLRNIEIAEAAKISAAENRVVELPL